MTTLFTAEERARIDPEFDRSTVLPQSCGTIVAHATLSGSA